VVLPVGEGKLHERQLSYVDTVGALRTLGEGEGVYQGRLRVPGSFYERFGIDPDLLELRDCFPDLILAESTESRTELRVVDVKASNWMKLSHRIQVGIYTLILEEVLRAEGIEPNMSRRGGVWLYGTPQPEWFDLAHIIPPIETFLAEDLSKVLTGDRDDAFWHLNFRCEWCEWYTHCRGEADSGSNVSLVPYLSSFAKRHLAAAGVGTVSGLGAALAGDGAEDLVAGCASLEGRVPQLRRQVKALDTGTSEPSGAASVSMAKGEGVRLVLTLQSEPLTGEMYGYAIRRQWGIELFGSHISQHARVAATRDDLDELRQDLVGDLMTILGPIHDHNTSTDEWSEQISVQGYVFDTYERGMLTTVLLEATLDPAVSDDALALLFHFQRPELVEAEDHPDTEVFFPVIALNEVVRSLFALPIPVSYQLGPVSTALMPSKYGWEYRPFDFFTFRLSNRMKSNAIFEVWHRGRGEHLASIERELISRVRAASSVIEGIREHLDGTGRLFAWPHKFFLPEGTAFRHKLLSRLAFIARYDSVVSYTELRSERGLPLEERLGEETIFRLTYLGDDRCRMDPDQVEADLDTDDFLNWILTGDHEAGRRARLSYNDFSYRRAMYAPKHLDMALAKVQERTGDVLRLGVVTGKKWTEPRRGDTLFLEPRYTDWTTEPLVGELAALDAEENPWFVRLIEDPVTARSRIGVDGNKRQRLLELGSRHSMTPSQLEAFRDVIDHDLQLVWGPPGTGKTHFLALAILCLAEEHRRAGRPFRALLTAMTNTAIDNLLLKLAELQEAKRVVGGDLGVGKLGGIASDEVTSVDRRDAVGFAARHPIVVIGATVWQARRASPGELGFDLVVIDEGSQLKVADSAIAIRRVAPGGRLVIAGDDSQLPPIVQAEYPAPEDPGPPLHRSILECLREGDPEDLLTRPLLENFRMCDRLCEYPRLSIYPEQYGPAGGEIRERRLSLSPSGDRLLDLLLDPDYPVTMCVLEDVKATSRNPVEAELAARSVVALREGLGVVDDDDFADRAVFVVSPHHAQIRLLRRALQGLRRWDPLPLVDTVDKIQGQERDAVVISYGVSDVETALNEAKFIFSLNRLNVAVTRARCKSLLFLPRPLLEPPIQVLDADEVAKGVAYMQGLYHWCRSQSEPVESAFNGNRVTVYRG
jgi:DNA replication ATP-dependent helicase Dna2